MTDDDILEISLMLGEKGLSNSQIDTFLEHHGVKGMKWGERRAVKKASKRELKDVEESHKPGLAKARKDPTFKREVKETLKGKGITVTNARSEVTKKGGLVTSRVKGNFKDSTGKKTSVDFGNAVAAKAGKIRGRREFLAAFGGGVVGYMLVNKGLGRIGFNKSGRISGGIAGAGIGANVAGNIMRDHGNKRLKIIQDQ